MSRSVIFFVCRPDATDLHRDNKFLKVTFANEPNKIDPSFE